MKMWISGSFLHKWAGEDLLGDWKEVLAPEKRDAEVTSIGALSELLFFKQS